MNDIIYVGRHAVTYDVLHHTHTGWELIYCTSGKGEFVFADRVLPYTVNQIVIIPPHIPHSNRSETGFTNIHITMSDLPLDIAEPLVMPADRNGFLYNAFNAAFYYYASDFEARDYLLPIYGQLIAASLTVRQPHRLRSDPVHRIETSILQNYSNSAYDLNACLRELPFNAEYLKKLFKKETGKTPLQYLTDVRLGNAANSLAAYDGRENISEIARLCGFSNPLYFSRLFKKKFGVAPRDYKGAPPVSRR